MIMNAEKQYKDVTEELEASRIIIRKLKMKYENALNEIKDLEKENQGEKDDLII